MIHVRPNAIKELQRLLDKHPNRRLLVYLDLASGGCFEWTYQLTFQETSHQPEVTTYNFDTLTIVVPDAALPYLQDLTIDYAEDLMGGGFRFINPQAKQTCGCGNSFALIPESESDTDAPEDFSSRDRPIHASSDR